MKCEARVFNDKETAIVNDAISLAEELVNDFYKLSASQWLKNPYDFVTRATLNNNEIVDGPHAQVIRYVGYKKSETISPAAFDYYKICLQDDTIMATVRDCEKIFLFPFILYIAVHELIHVVRFSRFAQNYNISSEQDVVFEEEIIVHEQTRQVLQCVKIDGLHPVLCYYSSWRR